MSRFFATVFSKDAAKTNMDSLGKLIHKLIELTDPLKYEKKFVLKSHGGVEHDTLLSEILTNIDETIGIEINVWKSHNVAFLTGHIDLILLHDDTLIIADYKPDESVKDGHFLRSIPQITSYALLLKDVFGIKKLMCLVFNKDNAWLYSPNVLLCEIRNYLISINYKKRPWEKYFI